MSDEQRDARHAKMVAKMIRALNNELMRPRVLRLRNSLPAPNNIGVHSSECAAVLGDSVDDCTCLYSRLYRKLTPVCEQCMEDHEPTEMCR